VEARVRRAPPVPPCHRCHSPGLTPEFPGGVENDQSAHAGADAVSAAGVHDIWRYAVPQHSESVGPLRFRALPLLEDGVAVPVVRPDVCAGQQLVAIGSDMRCRQRTILRPTAL
jgi:hypothetical protein